MTLIYEDKRYGDRYEIEVDHGVFVHATRHLEGIGRSIIPYTHSPTYLPLTLTQSNISFPLNGRNLSDYSIQPQAR